MSTHSAMARSAAGLSTQIERARPCTTRDPRWWDTFNPGNAKAIDLCKTACPFKDECERDPSEPIGIVRAGVAYDDDTCPVDTCPVCKHPRRHIDKILGRCDPCGRTAKADEKGAKDDAKAAKSLDADRVAAHHDVIFRMLTNAERPCTYRDVAKVIKLHPRAIEGYWKRQVAKHGYQRTRRTLAWTIDRWAELSAAGLSGRQVAGRLGISHSALQAHMSKARRAGDPRVPAADPTKQRFRESVTA